MNSIKFFFFLALLLNVKTLFSDQELSYKRQVTASDYCEFLNVAAATDKYHLYDDKMSCDPQTACIARIGAPGRWHYEVIVGRGNFPVMYMNEFDGSNYDSWARSKQPTGEQADNNSLLKYNQSCFQAAISETSTLTLGVDPPSKSTSSLTWQSDIKRVASVVTVFALPAFGHELMLKTGTVLTGMPVEQFAFTLDDFNTAAKEHPTANQLIIHREGSNYSILPYNHLSMNYMVDEGADTEISEALQAALKNKYPSIDAAALVNKHLSSDDPTNRFLSTEKLLKILDQAQKLATAEIGKKTTHEESELDASLAQMSLSTTEKMRAGAEISSHVFLKNLKTGKLTSIPDLIQINDVAVPIIGDDQYNVHLEWNELQQRFIVKTIKTIHTATIIPEEKILLIAKYINNLEKLDREERRADSYSIEEQDQDDLLRSLLSHLSSTYSATITIVRNSEENILPALARNTTINNGPILLYGFDDKRGYIGPRDEIKIILETTFKLGKIETMNAYNRCLNLDFTSFNFEKYCDFIIEAQTVSLRNRVKASETAFLNLDCRNVQLWADFLSYNHAQFDFSNKLAISDQKIQRIRFVAKNYLEPAGLKLNTEGRKSFDKLRTNLNNRNWNNIINQLDASLNLLLDAGTQIKTKYLLKNELKRSYNKLSQFEQKTLDSILIRSFFRKICKLGLIFARETNMPVLFVWKLPTEWKIPEDEFYNYLEIKPYKAIPTKVRKAKNKNIPEAITSSEMRHLGRLKQKEEAPNYLLTTKIEPSSNTIPSEAVDETKGETK